MRAAARPVSSQPREFLHGFEGINLINIFVGPQANNSRKPQRIAALVPLGWLNPVKSYFDYNARLNNSHPTMGKFLQRVRAKPFSHLGNFGIGQSGIGFPDIEQFAIVF